MFEPNDEQPKIFLSDEGPTLETLVPVSYLFIFRFVSRLCLRSTLRLLI